MAHGSQPIPTLPGSDDFTLQANALLSGPGGLLAKDPAQRTSDAVKVRDRFAAMAGRQMGFSSGATVTLKRARSRWWIIAAAAAAVVLVGGAATGITLKATHHHTPAKPRPAVTGDVTGDRKGDLLFGDGFVSISNDAASYHAPIFPSTGRAFGNRTAAAQDGNLIGDVDGDGREDVVLVTGTGSLLHITSTAKHQQDGAMQVPVSGQEVAMLAADFNGDGRADVAVVSIGDGKKLPSYHDGAAYEKITDLQLTISVALSQAPTNGTEGTWGKSTTWFAHPWKVTPEDVKIDNGGADLEGYHYAVGDVNGDGRADISFGQWREYPAVAQMLINGGGKFTVETLGKSYAPYPGTAGPYAAQGQPDSEVPLFADVNRDGKDELVIYSGIGGKNGTNPTIEVYSWNTADSNFIHDASWDMKNPIVPGKLLGDEQPAVVDVNGDGRDDIVNPFRS
ncbi:MAG: VCBS repeat-containing protein, partial [Mycobacterium sp.]|nr:VCBS repeat-containing protein [Mycobacterium sp.]